MLGALVHAGIDPDLFRRTISALGVDARVEIETVNRSGIGSTKVHVLTAEAEHDDAHLAHVARSHEHSNSEMSPEKSGCSHRHGRSWKEIHDLISSARIDSDSRAIALRAFHFLGQAEAKIHNIPIEQIRFHEVGMIDAIVDIVCAAVGCGSLGVERWVCSPLNVGGGTVKCAHGIFPVPAPATQELLKGARVYSTGVQAELVTPTGAAILRALGAEFVDMPAMTVERTGYGAGTRELPGMANVLRITIGEAEQYEPGPGCDVVTVIETAVDDLTPQLIGYVMEHALAAGALDAMVTPVLMKKNRPGHLLTVLCERQQAPALCNLLLRETTSLGVRLREERRQTLQRKFATVRTIWGEVRVKLAYLNEALTNVAPEYDDCRRVAEQHKIPLKVVMQEVARLYREVHAAAAD